MPLYEYQCDACGHRFEVIQKYLGRAARRCPKCGGAVQKLLSSPAIQFKGTGFYITDYGARRQERQRRRPSGKQRDGESAESRASRARRRVEGVERERRRRRESKSDESKARRRRRRRRQPSESKDRARATPRRQQRRRAESPSRRPPADRRYRFDDVPDRDSRVLAERLGQIRPAQREVHHRLQEAQLVAGVVAHAVDLERVDRARLQQPPQSVGELDLAGLRSDAVASSAGKMSGVSM